jgi:hypothetical protein
MNTDLPDPRVDVPLVAGELRGFRQFHLRADGLYPLVHWGFGPWDGTLEHARCAVGGRHASPDVACRCGLYAWYYPGNATVTVGPIAAVVAARGRCILADRGFRAASARIEAVALPVLVRCNPVLARRTRRMLAERYPRVTVYGSTRRMLRDHPPHSVAGLGIDPPEDHSRGYRAAVTWLWAGLHCLCYSMALLPRAVLAEVANAWWPALVVLAVGCQAAMVWLVDRLLTTQGQQAPRRP